MLGESQGTPVSLDNATKQKSDLSSCLSRLGHDLEQLGSHPSHSAELAFHIITICIKCSCGCQELSLGSAGDEELGYGIIPVLVTGPGIVCAGGIRGETLAPLELCGCLLWSDDVISKAWSVMEQLLCSVFGRRSL